MSSTFPRTKRSRLGYNVDQVEAFLEEAKRSYTADRPELVTVSSEGIRTAAFAMEKGGYAPDPVDAALERLEDAFANRERDRMLREQGEPAWRAEIEAIERDVLGRLSRPHGHRFDRVNLLRTGYSRKEVDLFCNRLARHFGGGIALTPEDLRTAAFHPQRGGYRETQVDLLIDSATRVILAMR